MSEPTRILAPPDGQAGPEGAVPIAGVTAGSYLRNAREAAGLHIGALAVSLKVPVKKLEALEADRIDLLPDAVFARALAASVCRTLKLDPAEVLKLLPAQHKPSLQIAARVSAATVPSRTMGWNPSVLSRVSKPVLVGAALLLLAAVAVFVYPVFKDQDTAMDSPVSNGAMANQPVALGAATNEPVAAVVEPSGNASAVAVPVAPVAVQTATPPAATAAVVAQPANIAAPSSAEPLTFTARSVSWVQVTDANGVASLRKTLAEGETVAVSGALPLSVVVGRANAIEVVVRGKPMDLTPVTRDNVARFQVK